MSLSYFIVILNILVTHQIFCRYDVDNTDLLRLRLLAQQKQLVNYNDAKNAK